MSTCGIYKITNQKNGKVYIGQSINIEQRWKKHMFDLSYGKVNHLYNAMRLYGLAHFSIQVLEALPREALDEREIYFISVYESHNPEKGYNLTFGGKHYRLTPETIEKVSKSRRGIKKSEEHKKSLSESLKGRPCPDHVKKALTGRNISESTRIKLSETQKKRWASTSRKKPHVSEETKIKMSESAKARITSQKGIPKTEEHKAKLSAANKGKHGFGSKRTEEEKQKISKGLTGLVWYTNGLVSVRQRECPDGFWKGRGPRKASENA